MPVCEESLDLSEIEAELAFHWKGTVVFVSVLTTVIAYGFAQVSDV